MSQHRNTAHVHITTPEKRLSSLRWQRKCARNAAEALEQRASARRREAEAFDEQIRLLEAELKDADPEAYARIHDVSGGAR